MSNKDPLLKSGRYEFFISGVITQDKEDNLLKTHNGDVYQKLKLSVLDRDGYNRYVYDPIFRPKRLEQILRCIGSSVLAERYQQENFNLEDLIGTGGLCIIALRAGKDGYEDQNAVDCYIQKEIGMLLHDVNEANKYNTKPKLISETVSSRDFDDEVQF